MSPLKVHEDTDSNRPVTGTDELAQSSVDDGELLALAAEARSRGTTIARLVGEQVRAEQDAAYTAAEEAVAAAIAEQSLAHMARWITRDAVKWVVDAGGPDHIDVARVVADEVALRREFKKWLSENPEAGWLDLLERALVACVAHGRIAATSFVSDEAYRLFCAKYGIAVGEHPSLTEQADGAAHGAA